MATINGTSGDDILNGTTGADTISGLAGNDELIGDEGDDTLHGGDGGDIYKYFIGDGDDTIEDNGDTAADTLKSGAGINHEDWSFLRTGDDLEIITNESGTVTIVNAFAADLSDRIENIASSDDLVRISWGDRGGVRDVKAVTAIDGNLTATAGSGSYLLGGTGDNTLTGSSGTDILYGGDGDDILEGGGGSALDYLWGGDGNDTLYDYLNTASGDDDNSVDRLVGGAGDDKLYASGGGLNHLTGGAGSDYYYVDKNDSTAGEIDFIFDESGSNDIVDFDDIDIARISIGKYSSDGVKFQVADKAFGYKKHYDVNLAYQFISGNEIEKFRFDGIDYALDFGKVQKTTHDGTSGNDLIKGAYDYQTINAGDGDDIIYQALYNNNGGAGNDIYIVSHYPDDIAAGLNYGTTIYDESGSNDTLIMKAFDTTLWDFSRSGNNLVIDGSGGDLPSQGVTVTVTDFFIPDHIIENISIEDSSFSFSYNPTETLTPNADTYTATSTTSPLGLDDNIIDALAGDDVIHAGIGNDIVWGRAGTDTLNGEAGNDYLDGGDGNDTLNGGDGNDVLIGGAGIDTLTGGLGMDTADYSAAAAGAVINLQNGNVSDDGNGASDTVSEIENVIGTAFADTINGSSGDNVIWAGAGDDVVSANSGNDTVYGEAGDDILRGNYGADILEGGDGADILKGAGGDDTLKGGAGNDTLRGESDNDTLYGGDGLDTLYGQSGADTFVFEAASAFNNIDVVKDFDDTQGDALDISDILTGITLTSTTIDDYIQITDDGSDSHLFVDTGGTGTFGAGTQIAMTEGYTGFTTGSTATEAELWTACNTDYSIVA